MRKKDFLEIKNLDEKALIVKVKGLKVEIANLVIDKNMSKLKDLKIIFKKRRDLAQILTTLRQKQLLRELEAKVQVKETK